MKILMVCLGNICRSPLAQGLLEHKVRHRQLDWEVDSAGTGSYHTGEPPDPRSIAIARRYGLDISGQRARPLKVEDLHRFDLVFAMDQANYRDILRLYQPGMSQAEIDLILNLVYPGENREVPDPYWNDDGFEQVYQLLHEATDRLLEEAMGEVDQEGR